MLFYYILRRVLNFVPSPPLLVNAFLWYLIYYLDMTGPKKFWFDEFCCPIWIEFCFNTSAKSYYTSWSFYESWLKLLSFYRVELFDLFFFSRLSYNYTFLSVENSWDVEATKALFEAASFSWVSWTSWLWCCCCMWDWTIFSPRKVALNLLGDYVVVAFWFTP